MEHLKALWPVLISCTGFIVWLVRLEGRIEAVKASNQETQKDVDALRIEHNTLNHQTVKQLAEIRESLARIEGRLSVEK